jgi:predicted HTH domain antitoxin
MQTVAIRDLKNNPSNMTKYLANNESVFITKHSKPIGITLPLNNDTLSIGIKNLVAIDQYKNGLISLGKMAEFLEISKQEAKSLINRLGIDWLDYDKDELDNQLNIAKKYATKKTQ